VVGLSEQYLLQPGTSITVTFFKSCRTPGTSGAHSLINCFRAFINQFFSIRQPGITVTANVAQLLAFPAGKLLEAILPTTQFTTFGYTWSLNPGKFNLKEHMVITIMANVGFATPYTGYVCFIIPPMRSRSRDQTSTDHLGPVPATLLQPGLRLQLWIPECVVITVPAPICIYY